MQFTVDAEIAILPLWTMAFKCQKNYGPYLVHICHPCAGGHADFLCIVPYLTNVPKDTTLRINAQYIVAKNWRSHSYGSTCASNPTNTANPRRVFFKVLAYQSCPNAFPNLPFPFASICPSPICLAITTVNGLKPTLTAYLFCFLKQ